MNHTKATNFVWREQISTKKKFSPKDYFSFLSPTLCNLIDNNVIGKSLHEKNFHEIYFFLKITFLIAIINPVYSIDILHQPFKNFFVKMFIYEKKTRFLFIFFSSVFCTPTLRALSFRKTFTEKAFLKKFFIWKV